VCRVQWALTLHPAHAVTRVTSSGTVRIVINVMTKNMADFGYSVAGERQHAVSKV
jgi:hypothetical protein